MSHTQTQTNNAALQVIWEQLNGVLYDLEHGQPSDAIVAVEDCIKRLEILGLGD